MLFFACIAKVSYYFSNANHFSQYTVDEFSENLSFLLTLPSICVRDTSPIKVYPASDAVLVFKLQESG